MREKAGIDYLYYKTFTGNEDDREACEAKAKMIFEDLMMHQTAAFENFKSQVCDYSIDADSEDQTMESILNQLSLRFGEDSKRIPPRVVIIGPPGCGKTR